MFLTYSFVSKACHFYNKLIKVIKESIHIFFNETNNCLTGSSSFDEFQQRKHVDDEDEGAPDQRNHQCATSNVGQSPN